MSLIDPTNKDLAAQILLQDPETGEELRPQGAPVDTPEGLILTVENQKGDRVWRHTIRTEEV